MLLSGSGSLDSPGDRSRISGSVAWPPRFVAMNLMLRMKIKELKRKICHVHRNQKKAGVAMSILTRIHCKAKLVME